MSRLPFTGSDSFYCFFDGFLLDKAHTGEIKYKKRLTHYRMHAETRAGCL